MYAELIGYLAGFLGTVAFVPQIVKTFKTKSSDDLSMPMLILSFMTYVLYVIYGVMLTLWPVIIPIGISLILTTILIALVIKYSKNTQS